MNPPTFRIDSVTSIHFIDRDLTIVCTFVPRRKAKARTVEFRTRSEKQRVYWALRLLAQNEEMTGFNLLQSLKGVLLTPWSPKELLQEMLRLKESPSVFRRASTNHPDDEENASTHRRREEDESTRRRQLREARDNDDLFHHPKKGTACPRLEVRSGVRWALVGISGLEKAEREDFYESITYRLIDPTIGETQCKVTFDDTDAEPGDLATAIWAYAENLRNALSLIGASTPANPVPRSLYQPASLQQHDPREFTDWGRNRSGLGTDRPRQRPDLPAAAPEDKVLREWLAASCDKNLLIVAPVGAGKSCLIESFAFKLAGDLLESQAVEKPSAPLIPILISLGKVGDTPLEKYIERAESDLTGRAATLSPQILRSLWERLVLLIDGFDEIPHRREEIASQIRRLCSGTVGPRFVLTSRPGHGERAVVPNESCQRSIEELSQSQAENYVRGYFTRELCSERISPEAAAGLFARAASGTIGHLLTRPLYLKAWCDCVLENPAHAPPRSMGDLARQIFDDFVHRRGQFNVLRDSDRFGLLEYRKAKTALASWIGQVGVVFAARDFAPLRSDEANLRPLLEGAVFEAHGRTYHLQQAALDCGVLTYSGRTDEFRLLKIPVVEYLLGTFVADDAVRRPDAPELLIETFRTWIWRPHLHDILDYTFDALWHGTDQQYDWAVTLLDWAIETGRHDPTRADALVPPSQDDLVHPFALTALRWRALDPRLSESHGLVAEVTAAMAFGARTIGPGMQELLLGHIFPDAVLRALVKSLVSAFAAERDKKAKEGWKSIISKIAGRVSQGSAFAVIEEWMQGLEDESNNAAHWGWISAIHAAAGRVRKRDLRTVINGWTQRFVDAPNFDVELALTNAISAAARRVSEDEAGTLVRDWMQRLGEEQDKYIQDRLMAAIQEGACRVSEDEAGTLVRDWMQRLEEERDKRVQHGLMIAINVAARRVSKRDAWSFVKHRMQCLRGTDGKDAKCRALHIIACFAYHLSETDAYTLIRDWMQRVDEELDKDLWWDWWMGIWSAAGRLSAGDAYASIKDWMARIDDESDSRVKRAWWLTTEDAAGRISEDVAHMLITDWMGRLAEAGDEDAKDGWTRAIQAAAGRVSNMTALEGLKIRG